MFEESRRKALLSKVKEVTSGCTELLPPPSSPGWFQLQLWRAGPDRRGDTPEADNQHCQPSVTGTLGDDAPSLAQFCFCQMGIIQAFVTTRGHFRTQMDQEL